MYLLEDSLRLSRIGFIFFSTMGTIDSLKSVLTQSALDDLCKKYYILDAVQPELCMSSDLQRTLEKYNAYDMMKELKTMFEEQARQELFETGMIEKDKKKKPKWVKGKGKGKNKLTYDPKPKILLPPKRENPTKDFFCNHCKEGHSESRKLKHGALSLYIGNGMRAAVEAIRSFDLILPSGLIIVLDNCYFAPTVTRGVVSISCLVNNGYIHTFTNYGIYVSKANVFYFNAIPRDGIYEIDMRNLYPNRDGLLQPTHDESHEKCKSCISSRMARKPFPYQVERAKDLLGLIQTDVCGPFRTVSREGASFFIIFTDDFSRYGFVYLMKHKHETLLDMVQSMMNLTTLPKSFWGYDLEIAARILNMVPTKKVDRTPYEIWHMKSPNDEHTEIAPTKVESKNVGVPIRRSVRIPQVPNRYEYYVDIEEYELGDLNEPPNYKVALADPESDKWLEAMNTKIQFMKDNQVWYLLDLPSNGQTIRCKWLFKKKTEMDGNVHTFKAHLVSKGFTQTYGVDYRETFSPITEIRAIRILLSIAAFYDYEIWLMDVKIAFLNSHLSEDVYMVQLEGFVDPNHPNKTRYVFILNVEAVDWKSAKQSTTAMSSIETEYIGTAKASMEAVWMRKFINGLGNVIPLNKKSMEMLCDNKHTLAINEDPKILKGAIHSQRKYQYICEVIQRGEIVLKKVYKDDNVADPFTKPMPLNKIFEHAMAIRIVPASSVM
nr:hypothetical protein [Tanacetum cinerariifolium]